MAGVGHGYGRISATCRDCGKVNDRRGLLCVDCKVLAKRANWRKQDAFNRKRERKALADLQAEPEIVPAHHIHSWMMRAIC